MKYFLPTHLDGGNRGCEAIARSTAQLLDCRAERMVAYSSDVALDRQLGLDKCMTLVPCHRGSRFFDKLLGALNRIFHTHRTATWRQLYPFRTFLHLIGKDDIVVSTGGDMLCYDNNGVVYTNNWLHKHGIRTVLWGGSMGEENLTREKLETLHRFSLIYTRESLTYNFFQSLGLKNLCLLPDPAFILESQPFALPACFQDHEVVGLNLSNFVMGGMSLESDFAQEVLLLIHYILQKTDYDILLIPHVTWNRDGVNQDDRELAQLVSRHLGPLPRLHILDIDNLNYCQIRYAISHCKMFIGARTHAVISAYSECIPALALGYSVKSKGIAHDLGLDECLVVDSKQTNRGVLFSSFQYLEEHANDIREHLRQVMPAYKQRTYQIREEIVKLSNCEIAK